MARGVVCLAAARTTSLAHAHTKICNRTQRCWYPLCRGRVAAKRRSCRAPQANLDFHLQDLVTVGDFGGFPGRFYLSFWAQGFEALDFSAVIACSQTRRKHQNPPKKILKIGGSITCKLVFLRGFSAFSVL